MLCNTRYNKLERCIAQVIYHQYSEWDCDMLYVTLKNALCDVSFTIRYNTLYMYITRYKVKVGGILCVMKQLHYIIWYKM